METKKEILEKLEASHFVEERNGMGCSESFYDSYYLTKAFLESKDIDPKDLTEKELNLLVDLAGYAGECFY